MIASTSKTPCPRCAALLKWTHKRGDKHGTKYCCVCSYPDLEVWTYAWFDCSKAHNHRFILTDLELCRAYHDEMPVFSPELADCPFDLPAPRPNVAPRYEHSDPPSARALTLIAEWIADCKETRRSWREDEARERLSRCQREFAVLARRRRTLSVNPQ